MNNLNSILIEGNLTRDPEIKYANNGTACGSMSIATNRYYKKDNNYETEVSYLDVKCYGKLAEVCDQYLKKGRGIRVVGRLKQERWQTKDTNENRSKVVIVAEHIEFKPEYNKEKNNG
jgi:single-strand DNA-binding protein